MNETEVEEQEVTPPPKPDTVSMKYAKKMLGENASKQALEDLNAIIVSESTHCQWKKIIMNFAIIVVLLLVSIFRGSKSKVSVVGVKRCADWDWGLFGILMAAGVILTIASIIYLKVIYNDKVKKGYVFVKGDFEAKPKSVALLIVVSLVGGFLVASAGIGGGLIFNPFLMQIDIAPPVASATGMYMVTFTTGAATMLNCLNGNMPYEYMGLLFVYTIIGTYPGLKL